MQYWNDLVSWLGGLGWIAILIFVGIFILGIVLAVLFMKVGIKAVKGSKREFGPVLGTVLLNYLVMLVLPCIGCFIAWLIISKRHNVSYGNGFVAWLISILIPIAIQIGIVILISLTGLFALPFF
jgi:hypothetical protein